MAKSFSTCCRGEVCFADDARRGFRVRVRVPQRSYRGEAGVAARLSVWSARHTMQSDEKALPA